MHAHLDRLRVVAGSLAVAGGVTLLFFAVALAALRPLDGLGWVRLPLLSADFGLDAGLKTRPLLMSVVAETLRDRLDAGSGATGQLAVVPVLTLTAPPSGGPVPTPLATQPAPVAQPAPPGPTSSPSATPTPAPTPLPTASPTPCNRGQGGGAGTGNCKR